VVQCSLKQRVFRRIQPERASLSIINGVFEVCRDKNESHYRPRGDLPIDTPPGDPEPAPPGTALMTAGTVSAVLFAIPSSFIAIFGIITTVSGESYVGGLATLSWGVAAVVGAYELNRSRFNWDRGRNRRNLNLCAGMVAVSIAIVGSGALENLLFIFAPLPALAAIQLARLRYPRKWIGGLFLLMLLVSLATAIWLYSNEFKARQLVAWIEALP